MKDRDQKQKALRLSVANRWFPNLEVDVHPQQPLAERAPLVTDLDILSSIPDEFRGFRSVVFDCKTKAKESPVNRSLWLAGVLQRMKCEQGYCILKKGSIAADHVLVAGRLNVVLLTESEFDLYAKVTCPRYTYDVGAIGNIDTWDTFFAISSKFKKLEAGFRFIRSGFWMIDDPGEALRKTLAILKSLQPELDPSKPEHLCFFLDLSALFSHALAVVVCQIFKSYLHPSSKKALEEALLSMIYGGRENYQHRSELYRLVLANNPDQRGHDLSLPEWERFLQLSRQILDAPMECQKVPLILREVGFATLIGEAKLSFAKTLCAESPQAVRFASLIQTYMCKACKLPTDFSTLSDELILPLLTSK